MKFISPLFALLILAGGVSAQPAPTPKALTIEDIRAELERWWLEKIQPTPNPRPVPVPAIKADETHPVTLPASVLCDVGRQVRIEAGVFNPTPAAGQIPEVSWLALNEDRIDLGYVGAVAFVTPLQAGEWRLMADVSYKGKVFKAFTTIKAGGVAPVPPNPIPPVPVPPAPTPLPDGFGASIIVAWQAESGATKLQDVRALAFIYGTTARRIAAEPAPAWATSNMKEFGVYMQTIVDAAIEKTAIPKVRQAIGGEMAKLVPVTVQSPLTPALRASIAENYNKIASLLEGLK